MVRIRLFVAALTLAGLASFAAAPLTALAAPPANASGCAAFYTVQRGDHLYRIAIKYHTTAGALASLNGLADPNRIWTGQVLCVKAATPPPAHSPGTFYTVARGDNLAKIGARFGWTVAFLARVNHIPNPNVIYTGQELFIPAH